MSIPDIRAHPWFQAHRPCYLAVPSPDTSQQAKKIDEEILQEVIKRGFDRIAVTESLRNRVQNEEGGYNRRNPSESAASPVLQQFGGRQASVDKKWALGLQSWAQPREIMIEVLKPLQEIKVFWKKMGHYNMKCRYILGHHEGIFNNSMHDTNYSGDESAIIENDENTTPQSVVKFELQTNICLICKKSRGHSSCFLISVLPLLPSFVFSELRFLHKLLLIFVGN